MGFWYSKASSNGTRLSSSDTQISPAPTYVVYPDRALGEALETADGIQVVQQSNKDGRTRQWVWRDFRDNIPGYAALWDSLLALRSRTLKQAGAVTPYVFLKEDVSHRLRRRANFTGTATAASGTTLTDSGKSFPGSNGLANAKIYIIDGQGAGQERIISSNTSTQVTVPTWTTTPNTTSKYEIVYWVDDFFQCRVLDVSRVVSQQGTNPPIYEQTVVTFVITDPTYNDIG